MKLLLKILKPASLSESEDVVEIPDIKRPLQAGMPIPGQEAPAESTNGQAVYESIVRKAEEDGKHLSEKLMNMARVERDRILEEARAEGEKIRETARREGLEQARQMKTQEIDEALQGLQQGLAQLRGQHQEFVNGYAAQTTDMAIEIASRILSKKIEMRGEEMAGLVKEAVNSVKDAQWITVEVSNKLPELVEKLRAELASAEGRKVEVAGREYPPGACVLKTSEGLVDASIDTQLKNLKEYFDHI